MPIQKERRIPGKGGDKKIVNQNKYRSGQTGQYISKNQVGKTQSKKQNKK
ncbi:MAG: hypothetical protein K9L64_05945 [Candidatus Izimaplasma sp.]|nr:hypothetical protein [Candidatus Izimaplasma bacterium]